MVFICIHSPNICIISWRQQFIAFFLKVWMLSLHICTRRLGVQTSLISHTPSNSSETAPVIHFNVRLRFKTNQGDVAPAVFPLEFYWDNMALAANLVKVAVLVVRSGAPTLNQLLRQSFFFLSCRVGTTLPVLCGETSKCASVLHRNVLFCTEAY